MTIEPIPTGAKLVHIGPHKTGSTALQSAFDQARDDMLAHGVTYGSKGRHDSRAVRYVTDRMLPGVDPERQARRWARMVKRVQPSETGRAVLSSEFFSDARDQHIDRVAEDLGVGDTWIAVTLRPLAKILPSQYQQALQRGSALTYDQFLTRRLDGQGPERRINFWVRHRHDQLIQRWADRFGADRVVVVVVDSSDHGFLPRSFERLLDLPAGMLEDRPALENRSMTAVEAAMVRRFNARYSSAERPEPFYINLMARLSAELKERTPARGEAKLVTPDRYVSAANQIGTEMAEAIRASGVRVLGDLDQIGAVPLSGNEQALAEDASIDAAVADTFLWACSVAAEQLSTEAARVTTEMHHHR